MKKYNFDYDYLANQLDALIKVKDEKSIAYSEMFLIQELQAILETAYKFETKIPQGEFKRIISDAIHIFVRKNVKNGKSLKSSIRQSEINYLKKDRQKYHLLTSLSFQYFNQLPKININKVYIEFLPTLPSKYKLYDMKI